MRTTSQTWKGIVAKGEFNMESVARIYGATGSDPNGTAGSDSRGSYREYATITAPIITRALLSGDSISLGNTIASQLNFTVMTTDTIPKSAMIVIRARVKDGTNTSEWLEFGTYWIDHRVKNDDLTDIEAYDAMKKGNQVYSDTSQALVWPKTIKVVVQRIAQQMGINIDSRTMSEIINSVIGDMEIVLKPNDDEVLLDILRHIGEVLGGNWTITDDNELRFIHILSPAAETNYIIDHANDIISTDQDDNLIHEQSSGGGQSHPYGGGTCRVPVVLGSLTTANEYYISKVTLAVDSDHAYTYGDDSGFHLIVENNPYASAYLANRLYNDISATYYAPFEATNAIYDPATELGDWVIVGHVYSALYNDKRSFGVGFSADVSAPGRDEMEDEYPYVSALARMKYELGEEVKGLGSRTEAHFSTIEQTLDSVTTRVESVELTLDGDGLTEGLVSRVSTVEQTADTIQLSVERIEEDYVSTTSVRSAFEMDTENITLVAGEDEQHNPTGRITFSSGTLVIDSDNFQLDEEGNMACYGASIQGNIFCGYENGMWAKLENGLLAGGENYSQYGSIHFAATTYDTDLHYNRHGIQMTGDILRISTNKIAVAASSDVSTHATYGATGTVRFLSDISLSNGIVTGRTYSTINFINGICTAIPG